MGGGDGTWGVAAIEDAMLRGVMDGVLALAGAE